MSDDSERQRLVSLVGSVLDSRRIDVNIGDISIGNSSPRLEAGP